MASTPAPLASSSAFASAAGEKSRPVTRAPWRANEIVSKPMRHCTWITSSPFTLPTDAASAVCSSSPSQSAPAINASVS
jgi:hypothetical protein